MQDEMLRLHQSRLKEIKNEKERDREIANLLWNADVLEEIEEEEEEDENEEFEGQEVEDCQATACYRSFHNEDPINVGGKLP